MRGLPVLALAATLFLSISSTSFAKTWTGNFPATGSVTIPAGQTVTLDNDVTLTDLTINGVVKCADVNLNVRSGWIMVHGPGARFECGTPAAPYTKKLTVTLTGTNTSLNVMGMGAKFLGAMGGGELMITGQDRWGWSSLSSTAARGSNKITLKQVPGWRVGDSIVIASTDFRPEHAEERTITAISGSTITLDKALGYMHWCATETYGSMSMEECAEVGLLSRNIVIQGDSASTTGGFGGHIMVMAGSSAWISGVELNRMGQKGIVARYPMHWHMMGNAAGSQYFKNNSVVRSYNRFVTVHGTHNVTVSGNVGYDTIGHGFYLEDGIEHGNVIRDNLGLMVRNSTNGKPTNSDREAAVFWISNPDNTVVNNVAAGSEHTGFWLGFPDHPIGLSATNAVWPSRTPLRKFDLNTSHSNTLRGLMIDNAELPDRFTHFVYYEPHENPADPNSPKVPPWFTNFTTYKNRYEALWIRSSAKPVFSNAKVADSGLGTFFAVLRGTPGYTEDSLFVGESGNKGNPESWEGKGLDGRDLPHWWAPGDSLRGIKYYDGPMSVRRTHFANYNSNSQRKAGAISQQSPNPFWVSSLNTSSALTFSNTNRVWFDPLVDGYDGDSFSVIRDTDGSLTGVADRRVVPNNPVLYTSSCTNKPEWNAHICPYNYVVGYIKASVNLAGTELVRDDGAKRVLGGKGDNPYSLHFVVMEGRPHTINLPFAVPSKLTFIRWEQPGKAARLSLSYPTSSFKVTLWGYAIPKASSLSELSSGGSKYYYDAGAQKLHLRLVSDDGDWKEYTVTKL